jgi:hypothetical protein
MVLELVLQQSQLVELEQFQSDKCGKVLGVLGLQRFRQVVLELVHSQKYMSGL